MSSGVGRTQQQNTREVQGRDCCREEGELGGERVVPRVGIPKDHQETRSDAKAKNLFYYSRMLR